MHRAQLTPHAFNTSEAPFSIFVDAWSDSDRRRNSLPRMLDSVQKHALKADWKEFMLRPESSLNLQVADLGTSFWGSDYLYRVLGL